MKLRHPWLIPLAAFLTTCVVWLWMRTVRYRYQMPRTPVHPNDPKLEGRYIYGLWHENLMITAGVRFKGRILTLISQHADGEFVARVSCNLGYVPVRGSSTRGGAKAMLEMMRESTRSHVFVTPDGPRGPRRRVQQGMIYLASRTGLPIVPIGIAYQNAWRLRSWDRFGIPKPGSIAFAVGGEPIPIPPDLDREGLESYRVLVEKAMLAATAEAEALANGQSRTGFPMGNPESRAAA